MKKLPSVFKDSIKFNRRTKIGICVSEWNYDITGKLYDSAIKILITKGLYKSNILTLKVPGSFELPIASHWLAKKKEIAGIICLGCIIKGETSHNKYIASAVAEGLMSVSINSGKPVIFGVLTTKNYQQAMDRAGGKKGNKGEEAAYALLKMLVLKGKISLKSKF